MKWKSYITDEDLKNAALELGHSTDSVPFEKCNLVKKKKKIIFNFIKSKKKSIKRLNMKSAY